MLQPQFIPDTEFFCRYGGGRSKPAATRFKKD
jgi:hypothetical protein